MLKETALNVKQSKCEFSKTRIKFLGHELDREGIHNSDGNITAVKICPEPQSVDNVHSFLVLPGYYQPFINDFSVKAGPLSRLLKKQSTFH